MSWFDMVVTIILGIHPDKNHNRVNGYRLPYILGIEYFDEFSGNPFLYPQFSMKTETWLKKGFPHLILDGILYISFHSLDIPKP